MKALNVLLMPVILAGCSAAMASPPPTAQPAMLYEEVDVYWRESLSGGPGKDGIPAIDRPRFVSADDAGDFLAAGDPVVGVVRNGEAKAYPRKILVWHEIVNDHVGGDAISVTYCPLTGTSLGFLRGETSFGVSGRLINSNLIMYDRETDTHWPQMPGVGIEGSLTGEGLEEIRVFWTTWDQWHGRYPDTQVLSRQTGYIRDYQRDPYGGYNPVSGYYAERAAPIFPPLNTSRRFPPKREVFGFRTPFEAVAVDQDRLQEDRVLHYRGMQHDYAVLHDQGLDTARVFRLPARVDPASLPAASVSFAPEEPLPGFLTDAEEINGYEAFWFSWYAFYPGTDVLE